MREILLWGHDRGREPKVELGEMGRDPVVEFEERRRECGVSWGRMQDPNVETEERKNWSPE